MTCQVIDRMPAEVQVRLAIHRSTAMTRIVPSCFLRRVLVAGAAGNLLAGSVATLLPAMLGDWLRLPAMTISAAGLYLLAQAVLGLWLAGRGSLAESAVWLLMGGNAAFAFLSILPLALAMLTPNLAGVLVICAEAWIALAFVELQHLGLARSTRLAGREAYAARLGPQS
ncbi:MAG TPA: hypothetical protein VNS22_21565 [Geminicoccus sp.]|uniref:hypothetical protein n=1 Tax=Geminicoccus sp. TaxID=2024832 RepID=UPI002CE6247B|nr:hypothetical protein [Geminicoccus sp.]HWL70944.1 hypothetical protein [Geminicoccus sp.]